MKSPDEIKKGLACCAASIYQCADDCPYRAECRNGQGGKVMNEDAIALIQQLQAQNAEKDARIQQLEAERDAAVEDIYEMAKCIEEDGNYSVCVWCDQTECERLCMMHLIEKPGFKWRGVQKEE